MAAKEEYDRYAAELTQRFEELTKWAIANWPRTDFPLLASDFERSRQEIGQIVGEKLGEGDTEAVQPVGTNSSGQYVDMNPMPWP